MLRLKPSIGHRPTGATAPLTTTSEHLGAIGTADNLTLLRPLTFFTTLEKSIYTPTVYYDFQTKYLLNHNTKSVRESGDLFFN